MTHKEYYTRINEMNGHQIIIGCTIKNIFYFVHTNIFNEKLSFHIILN
jgi:hypothetical protein